MNKYQSFIFLEKIKEIVPFVIKSKININDLLEIDHQKEVILKNTKLFLSNQPSSNILLWGSRGMGKSTLIKSVIEFYNAKKQNSLKLLEISNTSLSYLPEIVYFLSREKKKIIIFIDDIALDQDRNFNLFKSMVEGSLMSNIENIRFYITSNLRHLSRKSLGSDKHISNLSEKDSLNNLISLSDRFGCWIGFYECNKEQYLKIVDHYTQKFQAGTNIKNIHELALQWSISKGNFSGRVAYQFINNLMLNYIEN